MFYPMMDDGFLQPKPVRCQLYKYCNIQYFILSGIVHFSIFRYAVYKYNYLLITNRKYFSKHFSYILIFISRKMLLIFLFLYLYDVGTYIFFIFVLLCCIYKYSGQRTLSETSFVLKTRRVRPDNNITYPMNL